MSQKVIDSHAAVGEPPLPLLELECEAMPAPEPARHERPLAVTAGEAGRFLLISLEALLADHIGWQLADAA